MRGAELLLTNPSASISEIGTFCGFDSQSHFAKMFKRYYNCTPREYRSRSLKSLTAP
ncbi:MAG: helix-turn-helix domain-containing protein [Lachnospiraceae bacterium]|nr:helix-turn-helix domain-containing protein [Lachnospiraceae bacterium]